MHAQFKKKATFATHPREEDVRVHRHRHPRARAVPRYAREHGPREPQRLQVLGPVRVELDCQLAALWGAETGMYYFILFFVQMEKDSGSETYFFKKICVLSPHG